MSPAGCGAEPREELFSIFDCRMAGFVAKYHDHWTQPKTITTYMLMRVMTMKPPTSYIRCTATQSLDGQSRSRAPRCYLKGLGDRGSSATIWPVCALGRCSAPGGGPTPTSGSVGLCHVTLSFTHSPLTDNRVPEPLAVDPSTHGAVETCGSGNASGENTRKWEMFLVSRGPGPGPQSE